MRIDHARLGIRISAIAMASLVAACAGSSAPSASPGATASGAASPGATASASPNGTAASSPASPAPSPTEDISGQEITVILPSWGNPPPEILADFTAKTGVKATINVAGFDAIHDKIAVAGAAQTPLADVTEFDWTWTGQFASAGWYEPLDGLLDPAILADIPNETSFSTGGHPYAACYSNDFRIGTYNTEQFSKAGIAAAPTTFDQLLTDLRLLKSTGVSKSPLTIPLAAAEGTSSAWYLLTTAMGGTLFDNAGQPAFADPTSPAYKAFDFMVSAYKEGLVAPGAISPSTDADAAFTSGAAAVTLTSGPDELVVAGDPKASHIVGKAAFMLEPGMTGPGGTIGSPEGLGIMTTSPHKAAAAAFISWWMQPDTLKKLQSSLGLLPCRASVFKELISSKTLVGGDILSTQLQALKPLFPNGAPTWYNEFSTDASSQLNAAARGDVSVADAIKTLTDQVKSLTGS
jgi:multiple sugar transport system substrate-binding protein